MNTLTEPLTIATRYASTRYRSAGYWLATVPVAAELGLGGVLSWALRPPSRRTHRVTVPRYSPRQEP